MQYGMFGDWDKLERELKKAPHLLEKNMDKATKYNAMSLRDKIKKRIRSGIGMLALKEATVKRKGSSKPLIDFGDLMNSVTYKKLYGSTFFIGVPRNARQKKNPKKGRSKQRLVSIAQIHEFGVPKAGIPARPYVRPTLQRHKKQMIQVWKRALRDTVRGRVFTPKPGGARV